MTNITRTRSRTTAVSLAYGAREFKQISDAYGLIGSGSFPSGVHNHLKIDGWTETLADATSVQNPWPGNPVLHEKWKWDLVNHLGGYTVRTVDGDYRCPFYSVYTADRGLWASYGHLWQFPAISQFSASWNKSEADLVFDALGKFYNSNIIESSVNAVEAGQTKELAKSICSINDDTIRRFFGKSKRQKAKILSSAYLAAQFGIAPLVRDARSLQAEIGKIRKQCEEAVSRLGKTVRFSSYDNAGTITYGDVGGPKQAWNGTYSQYQLFPKLATKRCVVSGRVQSTGSQVVDKFNHYMKRYGSDSATQLIWELIPRSFVVDWFVDTGVLLAQIDNFLTGNRYQVERITVSDKLVWNVDMMLNRVGSTYSVAPGNGSVIARGQFSRYTRKPVPEPHGLRWSGLFGKKQFSLAAAMLIQRFA